MLKPAYQPPERLLADIHAHNRPETDALHLWWLGQSGFLLQYRGNHLLFDPYLSDSLTKKYARTDKPHLRMTERVIQPQALNFIDVATSTHNHTDHLDGETLIPLRQVNPHMQLIIPEANRAFVANRIQSDPAYPMGLTAGESVEVAGFRITAIPAAHEELDTDEQGRNLYLGYVVEMGPWCVYHSGDTLWYEGMEEWLKPFQVDVALLPINGRDPARRVAGNLSAQQAAELGKATGTRYVIPCHYDMFEFNTADPAAFIRAAESMGQGYQVLRNGEGWEVPPGTSTSD